MKHTPKILLLILIGLFLMSCSKQAESTENTQRDEGSEAVMEEMEEPMISGACGVSYFPILPDAIWTYRLYDETGTFIESRIWYEEITETSFVWKQEIDGDPPITSQAAWTCSDEGLISTDMASTNLPMVMEAYGYDYEYEVETLEFSGITFPANDRWVVGTEWTGNWKVQGDIYVEDVGMTNANIDVTMNNTIAAEESVSVPAGTYENALRVDSVMLMDIVISYQDMTLPSVKAEYNMSSWYVQGVGMVKQASEDAGMLMELGSME